ncbi:MAG TPA: glycosyltransferase family 4 protein [Blastocatellia bacterium]|nr:glycosyltransferase family 4 protein [Blastocatellia bacterium]
MRILYHHRTRAEDAQGVHIRSLQKAWLALGHEVGEVSPVDKTAPKAAAPERTPAGNKHSENKHSEGRGALGSLIYEALSLGYNFYGAARLQSAVREFRPALIYERHSLHLCAGAFVARQHRIPFVVEVNAPLVDEMKKESGLVGESVARWCERYVLEAATKVIVVSDVLKKHFAAAGIETSRFEVMHNGIDPQQFHPGVDAGPVRERYELRDRCVIGFVGWMRQWHRLDLLLEAFAALPNRDECAVLLVGDGPALPGLRERARGLGIASQVHFTGPVRHDDIPGHIAAMDITVLPSIPPYASPMKLFEYMAMGKAVIMPDQPNLREVVRDGENGILVPASDNGVGRALLTLATEQTLRLKLAAAAAETIHRGKYYWTENARRVLAGLPLT